MDSGTIAQQLQTYDKNKVDSNSAFNDAMKQYGVPELRQGVAGLRSTIANTTSSLAAVDPSVTGRAQGSLVTEAQRQRQVVNERAPIAEQLQGQNTALGDQERNLNQANQDASQFASNRVNDYNSGRAALQNQYDTVYTREQNTAKAQQQAQAQAADEAYRQSQAANSKAESDRNYALAAQNQRFSQSQASSKQASPADTKAAVVQHVTQALASNAGRDGYVSRATFGAALSDFQAAGGTTRQFWQQYGRYANTNTKAQYPGYNQR